MFKAIIGGFLCATLFSNTATAQTCAAYTYPTFTSGTTAVAAQVTSNFNSIRDCANTYLAPIASPSFTGNLGIGMTASNVLDITQTQNSTSAVRIWNNSTGAAAASGFQLRNSVGVEGGFALFGSGFSSSSIYRADGIFINGAGAGGLTLATSASQPIYFGVNNNEVARFDTNGRLLISRTSQPFGASLVGYSASGQGGAFIDDTASEESLTLINTASSGNNLFAEFYTESATTPTARGTISYNRAGGLTAYNTTSDYRLKVIDGLFTSSGRLVDAIPVHYGRMRDATMKRPMFLAHEVAEGGMPWAVMGEKDAVNDKGKMVPQQLNESAMVATLWAEVKSLRARVKQLEEKP